MTPHRPASFAPTAAHRMTGTAVPAARRERDFGVGYGRSSGYAAPRRYVMAAEFPRFRCA